MEVEIDRGGVLEVLGDDAPVGTAVGNRGDLGIELRDIFDPCECERSREEDFDGDRYVPCPI